MNRAELKAAINEYIERTIDDMDTRCPGMRRDMWRMAAQSVVIDDLIGVIASDSHTTLESRVPYWQGEPA